jgi:hypothetical protein
MPRQYPPHFRRDMVNRMLAGESVLSLVHETSVPEQTLNRPGFCSYVFPWIAVANTGSFLA